MDFLGEFNTLGCVFEEGSKLLERRKDSWCSKRKEWIGWLRGKRQIDS